MQTIQEILKYPNKTPLDSVQARVVAVYPRKVITTKYGEKSIQEGHVEDNLGNKMKVKVWEHQDISNMKGRDVIMASSNGKGLIVAHDTYAKDGQAPVTTILIEVGKAGTFQFLEVYAGSTSQPSPSPSQGNESPVIARAKALTPPPINGAKVGMALNNAVLIMTNEGTPFSKKGLTSLASDIIRISNWLEAGNLYASNDDAAVQESHVPDVAHPEPKPQQVATRPAQAAPVADEDIPF